jgi:hypothetical protein
MVAHLAKFEALTAASDDLHLVQTRKNGDAASDRGEGAPVAGRLRLYEA